MDAMTHEDTYQNQQSWFFRFLVPTPSAVPLIFSITRIFHSWECRAVWDVGWLLNLSSIQYLCNTTTIHSQNSIIPRTHLLSVSVSLTCPIFHFVLTMSRYPIQSISPHFEGIHVIGLPELSSALGRKKNYCQRCFSRLPCLSRFILSFKTWIWISMETTTTLPPNYM